VLVIVPDPFNRDAEHMRRTGAHARRLARLRVHAPKVEAQGATLLPAAITAAPEEQLRGQGE
jgi:hypothetical protein